MCEIITTEPTPSNYEVTKHRPLHPAAESLPVLYPLPGTVKS